MTFFVAFFEAKNNKKIPENVRLYCNTTNTTTIYLRVLLTREKANVASDKVLPNVYFNKQTCTEYSNGWGASIILVNLCAKDFLIYGRWIWGEFFVSYLDSHAERNLPKVKTHKGNMSLNLVSRHVHTSLRTFFYDEMKSVARYSN